MARKPSGLLSASKPKAPPAPEVAGSNVGSADRRNGREGKKMVAVWADADCARALRMLAVNKDATIQDLVLHAIDLLFREEGLPEIASPRRPGIAA